MESVSVCEVGNRIALAVGQYANGNEDFEGVYLSNFVIDLKAEVDAGPQSGYLCLVKFMDGECLGTAYFTNCDVQDGREKFTHALANSLGVYKLACNLSKTQLNKYLMLKVEDYYLDRENQHSYIAAGNVGMQPDSNTWVFNESFQMKLHDQNDDKSSKSYIWIGRKNCGKPSHYIAPAIMSSNAKPLGPGEKPLQKLIMAITNCYQSLTPAALLTLGSQVLCVHYTNILHMAHQVPVGLLYGNVQCGKSRAQECAVSIVGAKEFAVIRQTSSDLVFTDLSSRSTLGYALDDPSNMSVLSEKILNNFEGKQVVGGGKHLRPLSTFTASVNMPLLKKLSSETRLISRVVLIPFSASTFSQDKGIPVSERRKLDKELDEAMEFASSAAELVVKIGVELKNEKELDRILKKVENLLPDEGQALQRVTTSYGWLLFATEKVLEFSEVDDIAGFKDVVWKYFTEKVVPDICKYQLKTDMNDISHKSVLNVLVEAVKQLPLSQTLTFLKVSNSVKGMPQGKYICFNFNQLSVCLKTLELSAITEAVFMRQFPSAKKLQTTFLQPNTNLCSIPPRGSPHCSFKRGVVVAANAMPSWVIDEIEIAISKEVRPKWQTPNKFQFDSSDDEDDFRKPPLKRSQPSSSTSVTSGKIDNTCDTISDNESSDDCFEVQLLRVLPQKSPPKTSKPLSKASHIMQSPHGSRIKVGNLQSQPNLVSRSPFKNRKRQAFTLSRRPKKVIKTTSTADEQFQLQSPDTIVRQLFHCDSHQSKMLTPVSASARSPSPVLTGPEQQPTVDTCANSSPVIPTPTPVSASVRSSSPVLTEVCQQSTAVDISSLEHDDGLSLVTADDQSQKTKELTEKVLQSKTTIKTRPVALPVKKVKKQNAKS